MYDDKQKNFITEFLFLVWADKIPEYFLNFSPMNISQKWENIFSDNPFKVDLTDRTIKNIRRRKN